MTKTRLLFLILILNASLFACDGTSDHKNHKETIVIGALLPFSGEQAAVGINIEQAILLAIRDINLAGGINGKKMMLVSRDSNSGSARGKEEAKKLIFNEDIKFLIGPEENNLAKEIVSHIKENDVLNILPGYAAPIIRDIGTQGAWLRLAPTPSEIGCAMAIEAINKGYTTAVSIISSDDYQMQLASEFTAFFSRLGGKSLGMITFNPNETSYKDRIEMIASQGSQLTLLMAYPSTASQIIREWSLTRAHTNWFLTPTLHTEMFLQNIPVGIINSDLVFSPSTSLASECEIEQEVFTGPTPDDVKDHLKCNKDNIGLFIEHYEQYWGDKNLLSTSLFYYDAVMLLALGLKSAEAQNISNPKALELRRIIETVASSEGEIISWHNITRGFDEIDKGRDISYKGVAAEYNFNTGESRISYGIAVHRIIDTWLVKNNQYLFNKTIDVNCGSRLAN